MPLYLVVEPCIYTTDAFAVHHREAGAVVDIPHDVATSLGDAVRPMESGAAPDRFAAEQLPDVKVSVDGVDKGPGRRGKRPDDAHPGEVIEGGDG